MRRISSRTRPDVVQQLRIAQRGARWASRTVHPLPPSVWMASAFHLYGGFQRRTGCKPPYRQAQRPCRPRSSAGRHATTRMPATVTGATATCVGHLACNEAGALPSAQSGCSPLCAGAAHHVHGRLRDARWARRRSTVRSVPRPAIDAGPRSRCPECSLSRHLAILSGTSSQVTDPRMPELCPASAPCETLHAPFSTGNAVNLRGCPWSGPARCAYTVTRPLGRW